ncbi:hypothetical protein ABZ714_29270 [Streptomyces sp. NPDC006798]|uniref:hypothetical protein n=1 Tax=Streptomyces sp. NPDC006798 TaxID=3155462 RepID=UPI0033D908E8
MSISYDIASIFHPMPEPGSVPEEHFLDFVDDMYAARDQLAATLKDGARSGRAGDPLLWSLLTACYRKRQAEAEIRKLVAYAREFADPDSYPEAELAATAKMPVSALRTLYGPDDIAAVAWATGREPHKRRAPEPDDPPGPGGGG